EKTPLQRKLSHLSKVLTYAVIGICIFIFAFKLITTGDFSGAIMLDTFMIAVSLAVAAIPEGLATVVTIVLSIGVTKMSARNAVIRKLTAVETLGCAQIICSDKTGTLTQNKMTVTDFASDNQNLLAKALSLCCDADLNETNNAVGEPTECALVNYAYKLGMHKAKMESENPRVSEAPFDSLRKMMSTVHANGNSFIQYTKGAPDEILNCCKYLLKNGKAVPMTPSDKEKILAQNKNFADQALRVLAAAYKEYTVAPPKDASAQQLENELVFIGLVGMIDPVRDEVCAAIEECRSAGIRPIMITGDHRNTAIAIAKKLGIITEDSQAITGAQLDEMSDAEYEATIANYSVYARVKPENKVR
ncbi:MAG: HAD-IC family P-type ATPase, partial [Clostridia bacterium]